MNFITRLKLWQKTALIAAVMVIPAVFAGSQLLLESRSQMRDAENQRTGIELTAVAGDLAAGIVEHEIAIEGALYGMPNVAAGLGEVAAKVDEDLQKLDEGFAKSEPALTRKASEYLEAFRTEWQALRTGAATMDPKARQEGYARAATALREARNAMIEDSGVELIAAPDLYSLAIVATEKIPELFAFGSGTQDAMSMLRHSGVNDIEARGEAMVSARRMQARVGEIAETLDDAAGFNPELAGRFAQHVDSVNSAFAQLEASEHAMYAAGAVTPASESAVLEALVSMLHAGQALHDALDEVAYARITEIVGGLLRTLVLQTGVLALCALFGTLLTWWISRRTSTQMGEAVGVLQAIARGKLDSSIAVAGTDEINTMLKELGGMQAQLSERLTAERRVAAENARVREGLDSSGGAVLLTDPEGRILFANRSAAKLFATTEADLRKDLPQFSAAKLVGSNFDSFHKSPGHQRNLLSRLTGPHQTKITIGGRVFSIMAYPVADASGQRLGYGLEWTDFTQEGAVEREVEQVIAAASAGQLSNRVRLEDKSGFALAISRNLNSLLEASESVANDLQRVLGALASGKLTEKVTANYEGAYGQLATNANQTVDKLVEVVQQIQLSADMVSSDAMQISRGNEDLSQRTTEQAASLEETAASIEEFTSTVKQNADNAAQANQVAAATRSLAEKGGEVVGRAVSAMSEINQSSRRIADIIGVIDEIAFQTNLLALNAAVEAARAGEQGRGFAVVASEVRTLASRSADSAREIKGLIQDSVGKVDNGTQLVDESGRTLGEIVSSVKRMTDLIAEITAASREQATGVEEVNRAVTQMDQVTTQNASLVDEASSAATALSGQATTLAELIAFFDLGTAANLRSTGSPAARAAAVAASKAASPGRPAGSPSLRRPAVKAVPVRGIHGGDGDDWDAL